MSDSRNQRCCCNSTFTSNEATGVALSNCKLIEKRKINANNFNKCHSLVIKSKLKVERAVWIAYYFGWILDMHLRKIRNRIHNSGVKFKFHNFKSIIYYCHRLKIRTHNSGLQTRHLSKFDFCLHSQNKTPFCSLQYIIVRRKSISKHSENGNK